MESMLALLTAEVRTVLPLWVASPKDLYLRSRMHVTDKRFTSLFTVCTL